MLVATAPTGMWPTKRFESPLGAGGQTEEVGGVYSLVGQRNWQSLESW